MIKHLRDYIKNMVTIMNDRQIKQLEFQNSKENIIVGNETLLPISLDILCSPDKLSSLGYIKKKFANGLTAVVYKLEINNRPYNLKVKRQNSLVKNVDGQTSFLNEVQRRRDFEILRKKNYVIDKGIVKTIYANYRLGIMLSEWIEGEQPKVYTRELIRSLFELTWNMEKSGIMEWDLCSGNLLATSESQMMLFDFGYAYTHNPLTEYNSEGKSVPLFNSVERFETRAFIPYLLDIYESNEVSALDQYKVEKEEAIKIYVEKRYWLIKNNANSELIKICENELAKWKLAITSKDELKKLYALESIRSYILDIHDDISGKSCSTSTLKKINQVIKIIKENHQFLVDNDGYLWDDKGKKKTELVDKYEKTYQLASSYLLK